MAARSCWTRIWGDHVFVEERTVDVHIRRLRAALEPTGSDASDPDGARQRLPDFGDVNAVLVEAADGDLR